MNHEMFFYFYVVVRFIFIFCANGSSAYKTQTIQDIIKCNKQVLIDFVWYHIKSLLRGNSKYWVEWIRPSEALN